MIDLLLILGGFAFFGLLIWLLSFYWRRAIDGNIMVHFRAAEEITEHNQLPEEWLAEIERKVKRNYMGWRRRSGIDLLHKKFDETTRFFENGSFYADDNAKKLLLSQLAKARERWGAMSWEELLLERNKIRDLQPD